MERLVVVALVGAVAQLVDGTLGMAYGVTSGTLLMATGVSPAASSAAIHLAELGTTLASGASHSLFGNVHWRTVRVMALPGAVGAFVGAVLLSSIDGAAARPWVAGVLAALGVYVLWRFLTGRPRRAARPATKGFLRPLGLAAGFIDAVGGGGWGPVATPALLASTDMEPRKAIGSVSTSEFVVALGASIGFLSSLAWSEIPLTTVVWLLAGGVVAAPLAAWLVRVVPADRLGVAVGTTILLVNLRTLASTFGIHGGARAFAYASVIAVVLGLTVARWRRQPAVEEPALA